MASKWPGRSGLGWLTLVIGLVLAGQTARASEAPPVAEIERIVREYLLREPEVIMRAIEELQRRRDAEVSARQRERLATERETLVADARDPVLGNPAGDVTLVEFFDYRCGYCRAMVEPLRGLIDADPALRVVLKELPILGPESLVGAKAALAADRQGGYAAMHVALVAEPQIDAATVSRLAAAQGLDVERLLADMESDAVLDHIQDNVLLAQTLGIGGTPTFVVGETLLPGAVPVAALTERIAALRAGGGG